MGVAFTACGEIRNALRIWLKTLGAAALLAVPAPALSQGVGAGIVSQNSAVVTGFSQATILAAPPGADPYDYYVINPSGPSVRVMDLSSVGEPGGPIDVPKPFSATASQVGQVFGVTLDSAQRPNIYVAATSAYGLEIAVPDQNGVLRRLHTGELGAFFVPGQFGPPQLGGGPGSIWRIDGTTGAISLFANVPGAGPAALGGIAFDSPTQTIFVADRTSGRIYRYGTNGTLKGNFDHGVEARPSAGLPPIPAPAGVPANVQSPLFDTENPDTWGFAPPARRIFALAVYNNRLYYAVAQGPQIWSAGIGAGGAIGGKDARLEVELPSLDAGVEIAGISFDRQGLMYVAERGVTTGDYFLLRLAADGLSRVVRYRPKIPGDPNPGRWTLVPEQYSIGAAPDHFNADGGVALGYGYNVAGIPNPNACGETMWATGSRLLDPGDGTTGFPTLDGLQGTLRSLVQPENTPPLQSWFVDYDDGSGYADFRGHMGAIATRPCPVPVSQPLPPPPPPPVFSCPPGTYFNGEQCIIVPTCPAGTSYVNGQCVYPTCPPGFVVNNQGQCIPPPLSCPPNTFFYQGQCVPLTCPPGMTLTPNGQCACPAGFFFFNGQCVPPAQCPPGSIQLPNGICICPLGLIFGNGVCQPVQQGCPPNQELWNGICVAKCPANQIHFPPNGTCNFPPVNCPPTQDYFNGLCVNKCPPGQVHTLPAGACKPIPVSCPPSQDLFNNICVNKCPGNQIHTLPNGQCIPPPNCPPTQELWMGICVNKCPVGQVHKLPNGACSPLVILPVPPIGPIQILCLGNNKEIWEGKCVDKCPGNQVHTQPNGDCKPLVVFPISPIQILCLGDDKEIWQNKCVDKCPAGQVHTQPNGDCKPAVPQLPPIIGPIQIGPLPISPAAACAAQGKEIYKNQCVEKCLPGQVHKDPDGACGPPAPPPPGPLPLPVAPIQQLSPQALCALQNKDWFNNQCLNKCPAGQEHKQPNGACGPLAVAPVPPAGPAGPIGPIGPIQIAPSQQSCAARNMDFYQPTMMCVARCTGNQVHVPPDGRCGAPQLLPTPGGGAVSPIQIVPSQQTCAARNMDFYQPTMMCVARCTGNQVHLAPDGRCGPPPPPPPPGGGTVSPIQIVPSQQSCAARNMDFYQPTMMCVARCTGNQVHLAPDGRCGPPPAGGGGPGGIVPLPAQTVPSQATCAAQNQDFYAPTRMCVDKCPAGQQHNPPRGACGPIPASAENCAQQGKDFYQPTRMCVDKCVAGQQHNPPSGACGPIPASAQSCARQDKDFYQPTMMCVDKCPAGQQHNPPNGACGPTPASAQSCARQDKDFYQPTMMCVDKCPAGQQHNPPNGACGPIPASAQSCARQNRDFYQPTMMCVPRCQGNQVHLEPDGRCGPRPSGGGGGGSTPTIGPAQFVPSQATCAARNQDFYQPTMMCVARCQGNQVHLEPDGRCGPRPSGGGGGSTPTIGPVQLVPSQATCAARNQDFYQPTMMCVARCQGNQVHLEPDGRCGARPSGGGGGSTPTIGPAQLVPSQATCAARNQDFYQPTMMCVARCQGNQVHLEPDGRCGAPPSTGGQATGAGGSAAAAATPTAAQLKVCTDQDKDWFRGACVDKCRPNQIHVPPDGRCVAAPAGSRP